MNDETPSIAQNLPGIIASSTIYNLLHKQQKVEYMHQTFFPIPAPTLLKTITNKQLKRFPCMNTKDIKRHLAPSPATPKGRMKKPRAGIKSTRKNVEC